MFIITNILLLIALGFVSSLSDHEYEFQASLRRLPHAERQQFMAKLEDEYTGFLKDFNKKHAPEEKWRKSVFKKNYLMIHMHNEKYARGEESYAMGVNHFADLTDEEYQAMNGLKTENSHDEEEKHEEYIPTAHTALPKSIDWRTKAPGVVTSVKNQGPCGSCWSFAALASLESQIYLKTGGISRNLSEQQLVDCNLSNAGCNGGTMSRAYEYLKTHMAMTYEEYPYKSDTTLKRGICEYKERKTRIDTRVKGFEVIKQNSERDLQNAVAFVGPVAVAINSDVAGIKLYKYGIFDSDWCSSAKLTHAVTVVGYGTENGKDYWLVKNSWGTRYGISGYIKMARHKNICGITKLAMFPLV